MKGFLGIRLVLLLVMTSGVSAWAQIIPGPIVEFLYDHGYPNPEFSETLYQTELNQGKLTLWQDKEFSCYVLWRNEINGGMPVAYSMENCFPDSVKEGSLLEGLLDFATTDQFLSQSGFKTSTGKPVGPLISTKWSQGAFYNRYCPKEIQISNGHTWVGCVAVALGQIVRYFGPWSSFDVEESYSTYPYGDLEMHSSGYNWTRMLNEPIDFDLDVSEFLSDMGILVHTHYGLEGSSASTGRALRALHDMNFSEAYRAMRMDYNPADWYVLFVENLRSYQPIFVAGGGHAFVCDGIDEQGYLHFNLGASGLGDGFYSGMFAFGYSVNEAIIGIRPDASVSPPGEISYGDSNGSVLLSWQESSSPGLDHYTVFLDDSAVCTVTDTVVDLTEYNPGTYQVRVCSNTGDQQSVPVGPLTVRIMGDNILLTDPAVIQAISHEDPTRITAQLVNEADLASIRSLHFEGACLDPDILKHFPNIQELKWYCTSGSESEFELLAQLPKLQRLELSGAKLSRPVLNSGYPKLVTFVLKDASGDMSYIIEEAKQLRKLEISSCSDLDMTCLSNLTDLEELSIIQTHPKSLNFLNFLPHIRALKLSDNSLFSLPLRSELTELFELTVDHNPLNELSFFEQTPNIRKLYLTGNDLDVLKLDYPLNDLVILDATDNRIEKVLIAFDFPSLLDLKLSNNRLKQVPTHLYALSKLKKLNLSCNQIDQFPEMAGQCLETLNLSGNRLTYVSGLEDFKSLRYLNLSNNSISDLVPINQPHLLARLYELDVTGNPLSPESFANCIPHIRHSVPNTLTPPGPERRSPCFPQPGRVIRTSLNRLTLSWSAEDLNDHLSYEVVVGQKDEQYQRFTVSSGTQVTVNLPKGQLYHWQVRAIDQDTSFYSGLYEISTLDELVLPFVDDFDLYPLFSYLATRSNLWRMSKSGGDIFCDAQIDWSAVAGRNKVVHLVPDSDITLDLSTLEEPVLKIDFDFMVYPKRKGHFMISNINGLQVDVVLYDGSGTIFTNGLPAGEFTYRSGEWSNFLLSIAGKNDRLFFLLDQRPIMNIPWSFVDDQVSMDGLVFGPDQEGLLDLPGGNNFFIDQVQIYTFAKTLHTDDLFSAATTQWDVYPNPAHDVIHLGGSAFSRPLSVGLFAITGECLLEQEVAAGCKETSMNVCSMQPGIYLIRLIMPDGSAVNRKLVIRR